MAVIPILSKRKLDFSTAAAASADLYVILADRVDVLNGRELTLECEIHEHSLGNGTGLISIEVWPQSRTSEEPGSNFETFEPAGKLLIDSSTPSPAYRTAFVSTLGHTCIGALARVYAAGQRISGNPGDPLYATISLRWCAKDTRTSFVPTQLPNCELWLHADDYNPSGNWLDRSPQYRFATQSTPSARPVLESNFNGLSDVLFDGVDDYLAIDSLAGVFGGTDKPFSVVYLYEVVSLPGVAASPYGTGLSTSSTPRINSQAPTSGGFYVCIRRDDLNNIRSETSTNQLATGTKYSVTERYNGTTQIVVTVNGTVYIPGAVNFDVGQLSQDRMDIGARNAGGTPTEFTNMRLREFAVYSVSHSDNLLAQVANGMRERANMPPLPLPP